MSANKTGPGSKTISREELKQRLQKLEEHDRAAVAVFAARCALRVLPFTALRGNFDHWQENRHEYVQSLFVACTLGLEYDLIDGRIKAAAVSAAYAAASAASAYDAAYVYDAAASAASAYDAAASAYVYAAAASAYDAVSAAAAASASASAVTDLIQLEQKNFSVLKSSPLWIDGVPGNVQKRIEDWSKAMSALQLDAMVEVYQALLHGKDYPAQQIQSLIKDWYRQYGHKYTRKDSTDAVESPDETEAEQLPETIIRYDQIHANLHDGLAEKDALGRQQLVDAMAAILTAKENHQHQTIGLLGDWGAGKSTFVNLLKDKIKEINKTQFLFAEFNAWEYEHTDHMQAGVAREALKGLTADLGWWGKWWLAFRLSWQENPWYVVFTLVSVVILIAVLWAINWTEVIDALEEGNWANVEIGKIILPGSIGIASVYFIGKYFQSLHNIFESPLVNQWKRYLTLPDYDAYLGTIPVMKRQIRALCQLRLGSDRPHAKNKNGCYSWLMISTAAAMPVWSKRSKRCA